MMGVKVLSDEGVAMNNEHQIPQWRVGGYEAPL